MATMGPTITPHWEGDNTSVCNKHKTFLKICDIEAQNKQGTSTFTVVAPTSPLHSTPPPLLQDIGGEGVDVLDIPIVQLDDVTSNTIDAGIKTIDTSAKMGYFYKQNEGESEMLCVSTSTDRPSESVPATAAAAGMVPKTTHPPTSPPSRLVVGTVHVYSEKQASYIMGQVSKQSR